MSFTTEAIRNVAVSGHGGTGKTTLVEHILFNAGVVPKAEQAGSGKTVSDSTDEEIERKISIHLSLSHFTWKDCLVNLLDTPGSADFVGEVVAAFRAAESAVVVIAAKPGVQIETIKLWRRLNEGAKPRMIFVNKFDRERAELADILADLKQKLAFPFVPISIPIGSGADFRGVVDVFDEKAYLLPPPGGRESAVEIPEELKAVAAQYRAAMIESAAEGDDELMAKFFDSGTLSQDDIRRGLLAGVRSAKLCPVLCGSAERGSGVASLVSLIALAAPSPAGFEETARDAQGTDVTVNVDPALQPSGFVFKTSIDQFSGRLSYVKAITGTIRPDIELFDAREQRKEKVGRLFKLQGRKLEEAHELAAGDIGVLSKLESVKTNDTLCANEHHLSFPPLSLPHPVHSVTVSAKIKREEDKLNDALHKIAQEDLTFQVSFNSETKESVVSAMGELHVNMVLEKIHKTQKVEMETRVPRVAYRETITKSADAEYTHKKQSGGHGQYGRVVIQARPLPRGEYYRFENAIRGMAVSKSYIPGIEKGLHDAMEAGVLAGYPVVDVSISLLDGKEHPVDSSEMSFRLAAKGALRAAMESAAPVLLEPIMKLHVFTSDEHVGDILSDLSSRRGKVLGETPLGGGIQQIDALVPQAELLRYSIDLRSITSGTASFDVEFDHYSPIGGKIAETVIQDAKAFHEALRSE